MKKNCSSLIFFLVIGICFSLSSQTKSSKIDSSFVNYTKNFQEVVHVHLNKSNFIVGEDIGFTAYIFNKNDNSLSKATENLYCVISDENDKIIKSKLIKVTNGIASGTFKLDDAFESTNYTFKAYTNWIRNFDHKNAFVENFKIINPNKTKSVAKISKSASIDIQFLPESGTLVSDVINTVGVIAKDTLGLGYGSISGKIVGSKNNFITDFKLNKLGIGRFTFKPKLGERYTAILDNKTTYNTNLVANYTGIILRLANQGSYAILSIVTNKNLPKSIRNDSLYLVLHNGKKFKKTRISLNSKDELTQKINLNTLEPGTQIITLFDADLKPIAERLFFNHMGLKLIDKSEVRKTNLKDSLTINLSYAVKNNAFNNVSISILPEGTIGYQKNTSIISQSLVQPYLKSYIEDGGYYFKNTSEKTKYDLDNLLITQGWSSYNWNSMFNHKSDVIYKFEKGISINVNLPDTLKNQKLMLHQLKNSDGLILDINAGTKSFTATNLYPENDEKLYFSKLNRKGNLSKAPLYVQFYPNNIPDYFTNDALKKTAYFGFENLNQANMFWKLNEREVLDEIVIKANLKQQRILDLKNKSFGRIYYIEDFDRNLTLAQYINYKSGIKAIDNDGAFQIQAFNSIANARPAFFLDDFLIFDLGTLYRYYLDVVEYIEIKPLSTEGGLVAGFGGTVKIYTSPELMYKQSYRQTVNEISFPLTYTVSEKFYVPKYQNYKDDFYQKYGVVDWKPINKIDENGNLNFTITDDIEKVRLFIEGITADGNFIFEEKLLDLKNLNN